MKTLKGWVLPVLLLFLAPARAEGPSWQPVTAGLIAREKPGFGGLCGVVVERSTGHVFIDLSDRGLFRSSDQGQTWERHGQDPVKGRTETPGCLQLDPTGRSRRILFPTVYGGPVGIGATDGGGWQFMSPKASHVDWCAMDWTGSEPKLVLALKHESGGLLLLSRDGGRTFDEAGKGYGPAWVFDAGTAVIAAKSPDRPTAAIHRTTDGGKTFEPAADYAPVALPRWHGDALYWLVAGALVKTTDRGAHWTKVCEIKDGQYGPVFGKHPGDLFVLTRAGILASADAGATWSKPIAVPDWKGASPLTWLDYDPIGDVLYAMKMGSELYKLPHPVR